MYSSYLKIAAFLGALAVAFGAFGAHALRQMLSEKYLAVFETAVRYHFYHVFGLLVTAILLKEFPGNYLLWSGRLFCTGIVLFSGSLYAMALLEAAGQQGFRWLGAITPLGGLCFIAAWVLMGIGVIRG